jgi:NAD(P) transhydrogenase subunit beta
MFIMGLRRLSSPATARRGNQIAAGGMLVAVVTTLLANQILSPGEMIGGTVVGAAIGLYLARTVKMTAMPEMVAAFNGFGGAASALVAGAEISSRTSGGGSIPGSETLTILLSILIGTVTFTGSLVALGKLSGRVSGNPISFPGMRTLTVIALLATLATGTMMTVSPASLPSIGTLGGPLTATVAVALIAAVLGILLVVPIGGADMPVVVALLNSYSGLAAAATGFVLSNTALIVSGALVGASGLILTTIMCEAMNRSLLNVLLGGFGGDSGAGAAGPAADQEGRTVHQTQADDVAILTSFADRVVIVPGYGMAVAQAQHVVRELFDELTKRNVDVKFAIHPVAGRMPGHMNVLLAESNVPYDKLIDMDDINAEFENTDVVLVIGANDVVNPAAHNDPSSPIYGMPILDVENARSIIVFKRSMRPGYAGVQNELFFNPKTQMLFGDAKESVETLISEVKGL